MRIKHWQGYGFVTATKVGKPVHLTEEQVIELGYPAQKAKSLTIRVEGDHEWGLVRDDVYDCYNWLVKKFDKSAKIWGDVMAMHIEHVSYVPEVVDYHFLIREGGIA